jgi:isoquinoline 1-oxidoreductase subunit alpha
MKLTVNGQDWILEGIDPDMPLLWAIRDLLGLIR